MTNPLNLFGEWLDDAKAHPHIKEPTAMVLATADAQGLPSARVVLLKEFDTRGFVFYTNMRSRKSKELIENPNACLCFYWMPLTRQVRIDGTLTRVTDSEADAYFITRERGKQVGAWASLQSQPLPSRDTLIGRIAEIEKTHEGQDVPRPPHWSGWRLEPSSMEFWQQGEFRLHQRDYFTRNGTTWQHQLLYP